RCSLCGNRSRQCRFYPHGSCGRLPLRHRSGESTVRRSATFRQPCCGTYTFTAGPHLSCRSHVSPRSRQTDSQGDMNAVTRTASVGNLFLEPIRANTFDAALEWYFHEGALASVAYFRKDI